MSVVVVVRQDEVGREVRLEILEGFLDQLALERQEAIAKPVDRDLACAGPGQENLGRAARFLDPYRVFAGQYHPPHFDLRVGFGETHNRAAGANFNIVTVGAEAKQALHASHIQNR